MQSKQELKQEIIEKVLKLKKGEKKLEAMDGRKQLLDLNPHPKQ